MFPPTKYLRWADARFGNVPFDLGRSGAAAAGKPALDLPANLADPAAWEAMRARIAAYNGVPAAESIPALGASHALWLAYTALLSPGDEVVLESVTYEPMDRIAAGVGARVTRFERSPADGFAIDPARVARAVSDRTRVIALTNLHNPGGVRAEEGILREVAAIAAAAGAHLLVDEVYAPFEDLCDARGLWGRSARRLAPNIVAVGGLSKCYGLGAHRVGWVLGPAEVIERASDAVVASLGYAPLPWAAAGARAFERLPDFAAWSRATMAGKRARVEAWLAARPHLAWSAPREGLYGFAVDTRSPEDLTGRIEEGAREHGVVVAPGAFFGVPNGFRLAWSIDGEKLDEALARLARVIDE